MKNKSVGLWLVCILSGLFAMQAGAADDNNRLIQMSTTTSTQASGLLDVLLPELKKDTGIEVKVIAKGTGAAIRDGMDGNVDVIFVHAKDREEKFVEEGYGTRRYAVMHNDFIIVGPKSDPAGIKGMTDAVKALEKIAESRSTFISRGDDSGTHTKEQDLWKGTDLELTEESKTITKKGKPMELSFVHPKGLGEWYTSIGQGMGKVLTFADEKQAYTLTDRGTYINYTAGRDDGIDLEVLTEGDPNLYNPYGVIPVDPKKHDHVKYDLAKQFAEWITSEKGQSVIANYTLHGKQLFYPDAVPDAQ
ncbi:MAG: substrate-binding domain-containing protein [Desulfococcaceae bacterium]